MPGFHKPFRLDVTANSGVLLVYNNGSISARELRAFKLAFDIQAKIFEINLRKENWLYVSIYKPPSRNSQYFSNISSDLLHFYSMKNDQVVVGDFRSKPNNPVMLDFLNDYDLTNLVKRNTNFKGGDSCIDFILTNRKYSFKFSTTFEVGLSDHLHLI